MTSFTHIEVCVSETVVGLTIGSPTVVVPGSRQGNPIEAHEVYRVAQVAGQAGDQTLPVTCNLHHPPETWPVV